MGAAMSFRHHAPTTLAELLELLDELGPSARVIAGGFRLQAPWPRVRASRAACTAAQSSAVIRRGMRALVGMRSRAGSKPTQCS